MNVERYLERIGYYGPRAPDRSTLAALHLAHLQTVPFENLDIHLGREIQLDESWLYRKIVEENRGGFCYEVNGLFAWLLRTLGFSVTLLSARVANATGGYGAEFDHMALRIDLDEPLLADVGFGDSFIRPLRLLCTDSQPDDAGEFRLRPLDGDTEPEGSILLERRQNGGEWSSEYLFTLTPRQLGDYLEMCHWHQTSPQSTFTQKRVCTKVTPAGRLTLRDGRLIMTENGIRREEAIDGDQAWRESLRTIFGVTLP